MSPRRSMALSDVPVGKQVRITQVSSHPEISHRLRELGLCEDAMIRCMAKSHGNLVCQVFESRIGITLLIAAGITVAAVD